VFETISAHTEDIATLMTLEMGKVLAESRGEVKYGAEFFRWFAEEAVRIDGRYTHAPAGTGRIFDQIACGAVLCDHAVELSAGNGYPQDRPRGGGGCTMIVKPPRKRR
jgi:succinate-semialdehyde dehydrogenase/glutarate-semialdehyde dehydrogenase